MELSEQVNQNTSDIQVLRKMVQLQVEHSKTIVRQNWTLIGIIVTGFFGLAAVAL